MLASNRTIVEMIRNDRKIYQGDLIGYFRVLFFEATNCTRPYHNFRHMMHVTWLCYLACEFYSKKLTPREMRNLLVAALFHDFDNPGIAGNDDLNIQRAIRALRKYLQPEDRGYENMISHLIRVTQYPHVIPNQSLSLSGMIIRDADLSQALNVVWIQQVIFGLAEEWHKAPLDVLKTQEPFLRSLRFLTEWARQTFPQQMIDEKIAEANELLALLRAPDTTAPLAS